MINFLLVACILVTVVTAVPVFLQMRNHPKGLIVCFFAEVWERFSYYGMRALLIYYLTQHFLFSDERASAQYGSYTALVYLMPLLGGLVADRWLGTRKAIIFGAILLVFGHFGMAFEGPDHHQTLTYQGHTYEFVAQGREDSRVVKLKVGDHLYAYEPAPGGGFAVKDLPAGAPIPAVMPKGSFTIEKVQGVNWNENVYYLAVSLIIMGVGFMKPNISSIVGQLYKDRDPRRDSGFQLYYYGINLGSFWSSFLCGWLGERFGWSYGFGLAGVGMLVGLLCFTLGKKWLEGRGEAPDPVKLKEKVAGFLNREWLVYGFGLLGIPVVYYLVQRHGMVGWAELIGVVLIGGYVIFQMVTKLTAVENFRLGLAIVLTVASVIFWSLFEQAGSSLSLFAERNTVLNFFPHPVQIGSFVFASAEQLAAMSLAPAYTWIDTSLTASQTQTFNPCFILLGAPVFAWLFTWLGRRGKDPDPVKKFAFALVNVGLGFLILVWAAQAGLADSAFRLPVIFLVMTNMFHTIGELTLSPVGLSQQTKLSPPMLVATMMAVWFLGTSGAQYLASEIAALTATETVGGKVLDAGAALKSSLDIFNLIGWWGVGLGVAFFGLSFAIKGWAHGANDTTEAV